MPFSPDEYVTDPVLKVLIDADALLSDESKWGQRRAYHRGAYCIMGAVGKLSKEPDLVYQIADILASLVPGYRSDNFGRLFLFNDDPDTKFPDIKALFAIAIAAQREAVYPGVGR